MWGDGGDGAGSIVLGKYLSQIVLEATGAPVASQLRSVEGVSALNNTIADDGGGGGGSAGDGQPSPDAKLTSGRGLC